MFLNIILGMSIGRVTIVPYNSMNRPDHPWMNTQLVALPFIYFFILFFIFWKKEKEIYP